MKIKILFSILVVLGLFSLCLRTYQKKQPYYEGLQNMDASYLYYNSDVVEDTFSYKLTDINDVDLSGILQDNYYNPSLFDVTKSNNTIYNEDEIGLDVKYFNNISHVLMNYKLRNVL